MLDAPVQVQQVPVVWAPAVQAPEQPEVPELAQEQVQVEQAPEQPEAVVAREPLQVEAAPPLGAAPGVEQESARAGSE